MLDKSQQVVEVENQNVQLKHINFLALFYVLVIWTEQNKLVSYSHRRHGLCLHIHWHKLIIMQHIKDTQFIHYLSGPTLFYFTVTDEHNTISMKHNWNTTETATTL